MIWCHRVLNTLVNKTLLFYSQILTKNCFVWNTFIILIKWLIQIETINNQSASVQIMQKGTNDWTCQKSKWIVSLSGLYHWVRDLKKIGVNVHLTKESMPELFYKKSMIWITMKHIGSFNYKFLKWYGKVSKHVTTNG